jgi:hypothetical protein
VDALGLVERVARGEQMAGVEAQAQAVAAGNRVEQPQGFGHGAGHRARAPGHELDDHPGIGPGGGDLVERPGGSRQRFRWVGRPAGAGMDHEPAAAEPVGRGQGGDAQLDRTPVERRVRRRDVHHVRRVQERRPDAAGERRPPELRRDRVGDLRGTPLAGVRGEELHRVRPDGPRAGDDGRQATVGADVRADDHGPQATQREGPTAETRRGIRRRRW